MVVKARTHFMVYLPSLELCTTNDWQSERVSQAQHRRAAFLAAAALVRQARRILREAGARLTYVHGIETFSHALGTVRMGPDERVDPLDVLDKGIAAGFRAADAAQRKTPF